MKKDTNKKRPQKKWKTGSYHAQFISLVNTSDPTRFRLRFLVLNEDVEETECLASNSTYTLKQISNLFDGKTPEEMFHTKWKVQIGKNPWNNTLLTILSFEFYNNWNFPAWFIRVQEEWQGCKNTDTQLSPEKAEYLAKRRLTDPKFARTEELRNLQTRAIRGEIQEPLMSKVFGIDHEGLINYLKSTIKDKSIKWEKRHTYEIDHIKPLASFNVLDPVEAKKAIHFSNLQVISPKDNREKYANTNTPSLSYIEQVLG